MYLHKIVTFFAPLTIFVTCSGCGGGSGGASNSSVLPGGDGSPDVLVVSLNDAFTLVVPNGSEKATLSDARKFTAPGFVSVVLGTYAGGNPTQNLHARLKFAGQECVYESQGVVAAALTLHSCTAGVFAGMTLPAGTEIELENYDAPGYLLQADFTLNK